jgi:cytochrome oxidase Cu insertion factor (SCO1/SenC/PrrC family)/esterase/lipase
MSIVLIAALVFSGLSVAQVGSVATELPAGSVYREPAVRLVDDAGAEVLLSEYRGRPIVLSMFYTGCTSRCPLTMKWLREIDEAFQAEGRPVEFVLVSLDSRNDTPKELARYRKNEKLPDESWHLLTGDSTQVDRMAKRIGFGSYMDMGEHIVHGAKILLLDADGVVLETTDWGNKNLEAWLAHGADEAPQLVSFPTEDGGLIYADLYGEGDHGVVLAHGARFDRESWAEQARVLERAGFQVLAIDFRGYGRSRGGGESKDRYEGLHLDVLAAVRYLRKSGAETVSVVGGSIGGWASANAAVEAKPGEIDRLVLLAHSLVERPEKLQGRKLFITTRDDPRGDGSPRLPRIREQYERAPEPKELVILEGAAHAQHIFATDRGEQLMQEILRFLSEE